MVDTTGSESYNYDPNGRQTRLTKIINSQTFTIGYQYDAGGDLTQITYPSGRVVQQAYNQPSVLPNAVAPKDFARVVPLRHVFKRRRRAIN